MGLEEQSRRLVGLHRKLNKEARILLSIDEMIASQTALTQEDRARLMELLAEWQLLSDLSFADLILWTPKRKDYQSWPDGHLAIAHIRPTTAATVLATILATAIKIRLLSIALPTIKASRKQTRRKS